MLRKEVVAVVTLAVGLAFVVGRAVAQEPIPKVRGEITPIEKRVTALEQRAATLEQQNAELRRFIAINGETLKITSKDTMTIETQKGMVIRSGEYASIKGGTNLDIHAGGAATIKGGADVNMEGNTVKLKSATALQLNGSAKNVARTGDSVVNGIIQQASSRIVTD
jgi:hypothetical protein